MTWLACATHWHSLFAMLLVDVPSTSRLMVAIHALAVALVVGNPLEFTSQRSTLYGWSTSDGMSISELSGLVGCSAPSASGGCRLRSEGAAGTLSGAGGGSSGNALLTLASRLVSGVGPGSRLGWTRLCPRSLSLGSFVRPSVSSCSRSRFR
jgi:hypothetical protein